MDPLGSLGNERSFRCASTCSPRFTKASAATCSRPPSPSDAPTSLSPHETAAAEKLVAECLGFLREHAEHEDRHVLPEIARLAPELAAAMAEEHPELERAAIAVDSLWPRLAPLGPEERQAMGGELQRRFQALVAAAAPPHGPRGARGQRRLLGAAGGPRHRRAEPPHRGQHAARAPAPPGSSRSCCPPGAPPSARPPPPGMPSPI